MSSTPLPEAELARIRVAFDKCDVDGSGDIDRKEVAKLFKRLGQSVGKKQLDRMMKSADKNGDGKIDFNEFCSLIANSATTRNVEQDLRESFLLFDTNGDGFIDAAELKAAMKNFYALDLTDAEVNEMINEADNDSNGKIDFTEFSVLMKSRD